jgi:GNAT superfamily N-acetyltransferase
MADTEITELETEEEWLSAFPVIEQLRPHLDESSYLKYRTQLRDDGYTLFALSIEDEIVSLAGVAVNTNMYYGQHVWVYELITDEPHRSQGYGAELLAHVEAWGRDRDCRLVALSSGVQRTDAHHFYENQEMDRVSHVFTRELDSPE